MTTSEWVIVGLSGAAAVGILGWAMLAPKKRGKKGKKGKKGRKAQKAITYQPIAGPQAAQGGAISWVQPAPARAALR